MIDKQISPDEDLEFRVLDLSECPTLDVKPFEVEEELLDIVDEMHQIPSQTPSQDTASRAISSFEKLYDQTELEAIPSEIFPAQDLHIGDRFKGTFEQQSDAVSSSYERLYQGSPSESQGDDKNTLPSKRWSMPLAKEHSEGETPDRSKNSSRG